MEGNVACFISLKYSSINRKVLPKLTLRINGESGIPGPSHLSLLSCCLKAGRYKGEPVSTWHLGIDKLRRLFISVCFAARIKVGLGFILSKRGECKKCGS